MFEVGLDKHMREVVLAVLVQGKKPISDGHRAFQFLKQTYGCLRRKRHQGRVNSFLQPELAGPSGLF